MQASMARNSSTWRGLRPTQLPHGASRRSSNSQRSSGMRGRMALTQQPRPAQDAPSALALRLRLPAACWTYKTTLALHPAHRCGSIMGQ